MTRKIKDRPPHPEGKEALDSFKEEKGLSGTAIARIINLDSKALTFVNKGVRPYTPCLVRLYILTQDEAFKPQTEEEKVLFETEKANPPETLTRFLEDGRVPKPIDKRKLKKLQAEQDVEAPAASSTGPPFKLTAADIVPISWELDEGVLEDTERLLEVLIQRFLFFASLEDRFQREAVNLVLRDRTNELYAIIEASKQRLPSEAAVALAHLQGKLLELKGKTRT